MHWNFLYFILINIFKSISFSIGAWIIYLLRRFSCESLIFSLRPSYTYLCEFIYDPFMWVDLSSPLYIIHTDLLICCEQHVPPPLPVYCITTRRYLANIFLDRFRKLRLYWAISDVITKRIDCQYSKVYQIGVTQPAWGLKPTYINEGHKHRLTRPLGTTHKLL